jgi:hypothetical protein
MTPRDLRAIAEGHQMKQRLEWERTLALVNMWTEKPVTWDDITGAGKARSPQKPLADLLKEYRLDGGHRGA